MKIYRIRSLAALLTLALSLAISFPVFAAGEAGIQALRDELRLIKETYEQRIEALERRLAQAETLAGKAEELATQAHAAGRAQSVAQPAPSTPTSVSAFNPAISLILSGMYASQKVDPASHPYRIDGFAPSLGEVAPPPRGFSLGESELVLEANIDRLFRGRMTVALPPEEGAAPQVEEGFVQTLGLADGFNLKAGRFLSGIGYQNEQHAHVWDFSDAPLAYKAFFGGQLRNDGVQLKWLAPTDTFIEFGAEAARGGNFPATDRNRNGSVLVALTAHAGGDIGVSQSWRAGLSWVGADPRERQDDPTTPSFAYSGRSRTLVGDFVWKWAPSGNSKVTSFKLQGEYFRRKEDGEIVPVATSIAEPFASRQSGWYLQGVYQFAPSWRVGYRYDRLDYGSIASASVANGSLSVLAPYNPRRNTLMTDWSPSEFARLRLQYARDESRLGVTDKQIWLHYIMSLGAHGTHKF